jgi:hypothetical protein
MKIINFLNPSEDKEVYGLLVQCIFSGFGYRQTYETLLKLDYYIPEDQFKSFENVCNIMGEMDLGDRVIGL